MGGERKAKKRKERRVGRGLCVDERTKKKRKKRMGGENQKEEKRKRGREGEPKGENSRDEEMSKKRKKSHEFFDYVSEFITFFLFFFSS